MLAHLKTHQLQDNNVKYSALGRPVTLTSPLPLWNMFYVFSLDCPFLNCHLLGKPPVWHFPMWQLWGRVEWRNPGSSARGSSPSLRFFIGTVRTADILSIILLLSRPFKYQMLMAMRLPSISSTLTPSIAFSVLTLLHIITVALIWEPQSHPHSSQMKIA